MKVCLVAVAIGSRYLQEYNYLFRPSHENYASKCGYDFRVIDDFMDKNHTGYNTLSLNKILVCSQPWSADYDFIIFVDSDILINIKSPPIHSFMDYGDKIGIVNEYDQVRREDISAVQQYLCWGSSATEYYAKAGFHIQTDKMFNTGVLVFQPRKHREFLETIYAKYIDSEYYHPTGPFHYEQAMIGYELQTQEKYVILPPKFNLIWIIQKVINTISKGNPFVGGRFIKKSKGIEESFAQVYFMHFAARENFDKVLGLQKNNTL